MQKADEIHSVESNGNMYRHVPKNYTHDNDWKKSGIQVGSDGCMVNFKFVFFGPHGDLYAVKRDGTFLKGSPPNEHSFNTDWCNEAETIGEGGWADLKFLFFSDEGDLYAVNQDGQIYKDSPPTNRLDYCSWCKEETMVGTSGWNNFEFLFFGPDFNSNEQVLYAVNSRNGFWKDPPPTHKDDNWTARAERIGTKGWNQFQHLFFGPGRQLYAVKNGIVYRRPPPKHANDNWIDRATKIGTGGESFKFLLYYSQ